MLVQVQRSLLRVQVLKCGFLITSPLRLTPELSNGLIARDGLTPVTKFEMEQTRFSDITLEPSSCAKYSEYGYHTGTPSPQKLVGEPYYLDLPQQERSPLWGLKLRNPISKNRTKCSPPFATSDARKRIRRTTMDIELALLMFTSWEASSLKRSKCSAYPFS